MVTQGVMVWSTFQVRSLTYLQSVVVAPPGCSWACLIHQHSLGDLVPLLRLGLLVVLEYERVCHV